MKLLVKAKNGFHSSFAVSLSHSMNEKKMEKKGEIKALILSHFSSFLTFTSPEFLVRLKSKDLCAGLDKLYFGWNQDKCEAGG